MGLPSQTSLRIPYTSVFAALLLFACTGAMVLSFLSPLTDLQIRSVRRSQGRKFDNYSGIARLLNSQANAPQPQHDFQAVKGLGSLLYVHAALWQDDNVRITVVKKIKGPVNNILCLLWYSHDTDTKPYFVRAFVKDLHSYTEKNNTYGYIKCFVKKTESYIDEIPLSVSLVNENNITSGPKITLPIENRERHLKWDKSTPIGKFGGTNLRKRRIVEFTVCVPSMYIFGIASLLVEKLEMSKLLGAGRVVLYSTGVHSNVEAVLRWYAQEFAAGREALEVVVHSWRLPPVLHYKAQIAAIDDCLHRYKWSSHYMVFTDMDEFIVPLQHANWSELIAEREKVSPGHAAFKFYSVLMRKDLLSPAKSFENKTSRYNSAVLSMTMREANVYRLRSKVIVNPTKVESLQVHQVDEAYAPTDIVPSEQGLVYHYRLPIDSLSVHEMVNDTSVTDKYGKELAHKLKLVWSKLKM